MIYGAQMIKVIHVIQFGDQSFTVVLFQFYNFNFFFVHADSKVSETIEDEHYLKITKKLPAKVLVGPA